MRYLSIVLCSLALSSCKQKATETKRDLEKTIIINDFSKESNISKFIDSKDTIPQILIPTGTIQVKTDNEKIDKTLNIEVLSTGSFNDQEAYQINSIKDIRQITNWKGLFKAHGQFYVKSTSIKFYKERSDLDDEDEKTGLLIKCADKDTVEVLISGTNIKDGTVRTINLVQNELLPGQKEEFTYNGVVYTFYATGFKTDSSITNYKLFLMANVKGHNFNQLLFTTPIFGTEEMQASVSLEFAGDIDGDDIPDFIISNATVSWSDGVLYLSKVAGDKLIIKPVGAVTYLD